MASSSTKKITGSGTVNDSENYVKQSWTETTAAGTNTYAIQDTTESTKLTLKGSGDIVRIEGNSGEYTVKLSGKTVTLVGNNQKIVIAMQSQASAVLSFLDGSATVNIGAKQLGDQKLTSKAKQVSANVDSDSTETATTIDYFNDDPNYTVTAAASAVTEGQDASITLTLDRAAKSDVVLNYYTQSGTAGSNDLISANNTVTIYKGQTSATVNVNTLDDTAVETAETFTLRVTGQKLTAPVDQVITINDNDVALSALTINQDTITGTAADNTFEGVIVNNANTFQSGDLINGGDGVDTLQVELGNSSAFAIRAATQNVEKFVATVQSTNGTGSSGTNNVDTTGQKATVDAEKMVGVNEYWNSDSRADLKVEDIRILDGEITKDITIGLRNTDPGSMDPTAGSAADHKVDYEVYFSPESLRPESATSTSKIALSLTNPMRLSDGFNAATPLVAGTQSIPYTKVSFYVDGVKKTLDFDLTAVKTYAELENVLNASISSAIAADTSLAGLTLTQNGTETFSAKSGDVRTAPIYSLSLSGHVLSTKSATGVDGGWGTSGELPNNNAFAAEIRPDAITTTAPLITSTIVLDNVGREDEAGTLTIGSMSTHGGVERFEITVENNSDNAYNGTQSGSWLGHMQSTSNTLQEVKVVNAADGIANPDYLYLGTNMDQAGNNLTVMQDWPGSLDRIYNQITPMYSNGYRATVNNDSDTQQNVSSLLNTDGLTDVRLFDAADMKGNVFVGASITADTIRKYQNLVDTLSTDSTDDVAFKYVTGDANDSINLQIDGNVVASNSRIVTGRHDFSFSVDGGAGSDNIRVSLVDGLVGSVQNWYDNQDINNNVTINGGSGDDTIRKPGAGDVKIDAGTGSDTVYTDNTGKQTIVTRNADGSNGATTTANAVYAFNAVDSNGGSIADGGYNVFDLRSQVNASVSAVNAQVTVNYLGIAKTVYIANSNNATTNVTITDLSVNQAMKDAINNDPILNKLLIAEDGPGRTLLVSSLIDGADVAGDLAVTFGSTPLTSAQTGLTLFGATNANYAALTDGYAVIFAQDNAGTSITGDASTSTSDNLVLPGTGNDVVVLGTTVGATTAASSNETIVYDAAFGADTVVNFADTGAGIDHFDFTKLGGTTLTGTLTTDKSITVATAAPDAAVIGNLFNANNAAAQTHVYVAVSAHNIGSVYTITDAAGANNAVATLQGTIDLAYTPWGSLTAANFVDSTVANYNLFEGPNTLNGSVVPPVVPPVVVPGTGVTATLAASATTAATTGADVFKLAAATSSFTTTVTGFNFQADKIQVPTGSTLPSAVAGGVNNVTDGNVDLTWSNNGNVVTITLTGVDAATEAALQLNAVSATVFGTY